MHPEVSSHKKGRCPKCGMALESKEDMKHDNENMHHDTKTQDANYTPLFIIVGLILLTSICVAWPSLNIISIIENFMIGFFLVFGAFKLIDLKGFAQGYSTYDLFAKRWYPYGYIYPFIEIGFGLSMLLRIFPLQILYLEIFIMLFSGLGVLIKLIKHEKFTCVCLGTFLKVPLTKITLIEDFGMALLATVLLISMC